MEYLASTSEQWLGSGYPVTIELYQTESGEYYTKFCLEDIEEYHEYYLEAKEYFSLLQCRYDSLDSLNKMVEEELGSHCKFEEDEYGNIYGW